MKPHTQQRLHATLALVPGEGQPPAGALIAADGRRRPFRGWIELASAIEDWRTGEATPQQETNDRRTLT